ncbi:MAG: hypothetical protein IH985_02675 [Planctomycetes bacterium]|nr:hypothetical protein [Planctomycetota bacterium]
MDVDLKRVAKLRRWLPLILAFYLVSMALLIAVELGAFGDLEADIETMTDEQSLVMFVALLVALVCAVASVAVSIIVSVLLLTAMRQSMQIRLIMAFTMLIPIGGVVNLIWLNVWTKRLLREGAAQSDETEAEAT